LFRIGPDKCASSKGWHEQWVKVPVCSQKLLGLSNQ
jgi:hypothetical protein